MAPLDPAAQAPTSGTEGILRPESGGGTRKETLSSFQLVRLPERLDRPTPNHFPDKSAAEHEQNFRHGIVTVQMDGPSCFWQIRVGRSSWNLSGLFELAGWGDLVPTIPHSLHLFPKAQILE